MHHPIDRRDFLSTSAAIGAGAGLLSLGSSRLLAAPVVKERPNAGKPGPQPNPPGYTLLADPPAKGAPHAEKLGWRLGCQAYSFNRFTFYEAIDKTASLGLHYIEAFPRQKVNQEHPDVTVGPGMSAEVRNEVKKKLADCGVKLVCHGVGGYNREIFDFAKDMGIETLVCEPGPAAKGSKLSPADEVAAITKEFDAISKLVEEYGINVAIHNHPKPSRYWNPDTVLQFTQGRSKRIGACADTGHWMRSGINPIEALKKLEGRIISFHFKDLNQMGTGEAAKAAEKGKKKGAQKPIHDVPWGTGVGDVKGMLTEIRRQGIKAVFSIEYEYNWENSLPEIAQSVEYFDKVAAELAAKS
jgi:sugar phosphate isomerase/epimerase